MPTAQTARTQHDEKEASRDPRSEAHDRPTQQCRQIWTAKARRQLIFTSHNANLVINGDAELVVVCENRSTGNESGGQLKPKGAIDLPEVRAAITRVMEGGEHAFLLGKEKYGF